MRNVSQGGCSSDPRAPVAASHQLHQAVEAVFVSSLGHGAANERRRISLLARSRVSCLRPAEQDLALLVEEIDDRVSDLELLPRTPFEEFLHVPQEGDFPSRGHLRRADNPLDHGMARAEREPKGISGLGTLSVQEPKRTQIHRTDSESGLAW